MKTTAVNIRNPSSLLGLRAGVIALLAVTALAACGEREETISPTSPITASPVTDSPIISLGVVSDDSTITNKVQSALLGDETTRSADLKVETREANVNISGVVDSQMQIDRAIALAQAVDGVQRVGNEMSVKK